MRVNPYIEPLLLNAIDLLNNPAVDAADLERRWLDRDMPAQRPAGSTDCVVLARFLRDLGRAVDAATEADRVAVLNAMLRRYTAPPSITDHDGSGWHLHFRDPAASFGETLAGATTAAAAQLLTEKGMSRLGRCALPECDRAFVDLSRPGTQRYCSHPCANRDAVRRHRSRAR